MSRHRGIPLLLASILFSPAFAETAPWQQGTVVKVEQGSYQPTSPKYRCTGTSDNGTNSSTCKPENGKPIVYWDVTIRLRDQVLTIRPYVTASVTAAKGLGAIDVLLRGVAGKDLKDYVLPRVSPGATVKVAVFTDGTVTVQDGSGRDYSAESVSQTLVSEQRPNPVSAEPAIVHPQTNSDPIALNKADTESERPTIQRNVAPATDLASQAKLVLLQNSSFVELEALEARQGDTNGSRIYYLSGKAATARTHSSRPAFLAPSDLARELELYQLEVANDSRLVVFSVKNQRVAFPTAIIIETVSDGVSRISPSTDLAPGEYALSPKNSNTTFLFGVD